MFGLRLISKRELLLYAGTIEDLRKEVNRLHMQVEDERKRADAAVNALLVRVAKIAITPEPRGLSLEDEDRIKEKMFNIFGSDELSKDEEAEIERLQS